MPRMTIKELEKKLRAMYPTFSHVEINGQHHIGRYGGKMMDNGNRLAVDADYREALEGALTVVKSEASNQRLQA